MLKAQSGYNYDRPESVRPPQGGFAGTTPPYVAPVFPPNQASVPGGGYNYPAQADTDFPTAAVPTGSGYPTGPQLQGRPQGFTPTTGGATPYPSAQAQPAVGSPYPSAQAGNVPQLQGFPPSSGNVPQLQGRPQGFSPSAGGGSIVPQGISPQGISPIGTSVPGGQQQDENQEGDYSAIPGEPDIDYPILSEIPETSFDCAQQEYPGYYADVEARCQVFHVCAFNNTRKYDFLCPNGTIFSQEFLVCVWWNQFDCASAPGLFANNANLYETPQANQPGLQGGISNDYPSAAGPSGIAATGPGTGTYPAPGRPNVGSGPGTSFGTAGTPQTTYGAPPVSAPGSAGGYQPLGPTGSSASYPTGPSQYPSTQGTYPSVGPSTNYQPQQQAYPSQSDTPYPPSGNQGTTPPRDYLPPRRG